MITILFFLLTIFIDLWLASWVDLAFLQINFTFIPATTLLFLVYIQPQISKKDTYIMAIIVGAIIDLLAFTPLFTHSIVWVISIYIITYWRNHIGDSLFELVIIGLLTIFLKETILLVLANILSLSNISLMNWYVLRVFPTLLGNTVVLLLAYRLSMFYNRLHNNIQQKLVKKESSRWFFTN